MRAVRCCMAASHSAGGSHLTDWVLIRLHPPLPTSRTRPTTDQDGPGLHRHPGLHFPSGRRPSGRSSSRGRQRGEQQQFWRWRRRAVGGGRGGRAAEARGGEGPVPERDGAKRPRGCGGGAQAAAVRGGREGGGTACREEGFWRQGKGSTGALERRARSRALAAQDDPARSAGGG